jgi:hypothetical protein
MNVLISKEKNASGLPLKSGVDISNFDFFAGVSVKISFPEHEKEEESCESSSLLDDSIDEFRDEILCCFKCELKYEVLNCTLF